MSTDYEHKYLTDPTFHAQVSVGAHAILQQWEKLPVQPFENSDERMVEAKLLSFTALSAFRDVSPRNREHEMSDDLATKMATFADELLDSMVCREPAYGAPGFAHCAACCYGTGCVVTCEEEQAIVDAGQALQHAARLLDKHNVQIEELRGRVRNVMGDISELREGIRKMSNSSVNHTLWFLDHSEFVPEWDVYRDVNGNAVTYGRWQEFALQTADGVMDLGYYTCSDCDAPTDEQLVAIRHAVTVWATVCDHEDSNQARAASALGRYDWQHPNMMKSRLLHRMIHLGLPPTLTKPPEQSGGPAWWLLPGGDPFESVEEKDS